VADLNNSSLHAIDQIIEAIRGLVGRAQAPIVVAFDGRSGVGKSTMAEAVASRIDAVVVESDDFYAGSSDVEWGERTPKERVDLCIDWRRLRTEAIEPLRAGHTAIWRPFNFETGVGLADHTVSRDPAPVIILDGIYTARPELSGLVDLSVLVTMSDDLERRRRLLAREGETFMKSWHAIWDDAEDYYLARIRPPKSFALIVCSD
jgi:uridine kinase